MISAWKDKDKRDEVYRQMKAEGIRNLVKFSEVEPVQQLNALKTAFEIALDKKGRPMYNTLWCISYD